jgi:polygalacturonase
MNCQQGRDSYLPVRLSATFTISSAAVGVAAAAPVSIPLPASAVGAFTGIDQSEIGSEVSAELQETAATIKAGIKMQEAAEDEVERCEANMASWLKKNPRPSSKDAKYTNITKYWEQVARDTDRWHTRHMVALRQSGVGRAKQIANYAATKLDEARYALNQPHAA